jgi:hypothetical protein
VAAQRTPALYQGGKINRLGVTDRADVVGLLDQLAGLVELIHVASAVDDNAKLLTVCARRLI